MSDEFGGWQRVGGRRFQFYATEEEIAALLLEMLLPALAPYTVSGQEWRDESWQPFEHPLVEIRESLARHRDANHWIRSQVLTPQLSIKDIEPENVVQTLSFSGLILVQVGKTRQGRVSESNLGLVDRIRHEGTGRERKHLEYLRLYERLRRSMKKRLVVETRDWPMTARAADAHVRGDVTFAAEPVGLRE
jgi:hypothetical protein